MKLSIVSISYNQSAFLHRLFAAIDSNREDATIEHIVVDPGSTDGSRDIIDDRGDLVDKRVYEPDDGPADGLNKGHALCSGDVFAYVNADDWLLPGAARRALNVFESNDSADVVYGGGFTADATGRLMRHYPAPRRLPIRSVALGLCVPVQQSTFFRRSSMGSNPFNSSNRVAWDTELVLRLLRERRTFLRLADDLGVFTLHEEGITGSGLFRDRVRAEHKRLYREYVGAPWSATTSAEYAARRGLKAALSALRDPSLINQWVARLREPRTASQGAMDAT